MKNKRGDVPITILVIGVFAICSLALLSFYIAEVRMERNFVGLDLMEKLDTNVEKYEVYVSEGYDKNSILSELGEGDFYYVEGEDEYFEINKTKTNFQFDFDDWKNKEFLFSAKHYAD